MRVTARKLALAGLLIFVVGAISEALTRRAALIRQEEEVRELLQKQLDQQPTGGGGFFISTDWTGVDPWITVSLAGLVIFVSASGYSLGKILYRRISRTETH
jgi:hypothetical protein